VSAPANGSAPGRSILAALLGQGVKPSLTPEMHEREAERQGIRYVYKTVDLDDERVAEPHLRRMLESAVELGFDGLNVTHPVKRTMVSLVDRVTSDVATIGALNTVLIGDGETVGHNTDVTGFSRAFTEGLPGAALDELVLLGAGGAGTAVAHALVRLGAQRVHVFDPDGSRALALVQSVEAAYPEVFVQTVAKAGLARAINEASGLVNATPIGMAAHPGTPVPPDLLRADLWVADIVYRPLTTDMLRVAQARGCRVLSGAGMAVHQAADAFELITGRPADREAMIRDFDAMVAAELGGARASRATDEKPSRGRNQR
jgi:shikimate dehydrogenase